MITESCSALRRAGGTSRADDYHEPLAWAPAARRIQRCGGLQRIYSRRTRADPAASAGKPTFPLVIDHLLPVITNCPCCRSWRTTQARCAGPRQHPRGHGGKPNGPVGRITTDRMPVRGVRRGRASGAAGELAVQLHAERHGSGPRRPDCYLLSIFWLQLAVAPSQPSAVAGP